MNSWPKTWGLKLRLWGCRCWLEGWLPVGPMCVRTGGSLLQVQHSTSPQPLPGRSGPSGNVCPAWGQTGAASPAQRGTPQYCGMPLALGTCSLVPWAGLKIVSRHPTASGQRAADFLRADHCCKRRLRHGVAQQGPAAMFTLKGKVSSPRPPYTSMC